MAQIKSFKQVLDIAITNDKVKVITALDKILPDIFKNTVAIFLKNSIDNQKLKDEIFQLEKEILCEYESKKDYLNEQKTKK